MEFMISLQNGLDHHKPSLFELLSDQQLSALIPPSLRYLLTVATHRHPRYLLRILNSFDEVYALLMLAVERHYLKTYRAGFTENFYGLKRERVLHVKGGEAPRASIGASTLMRETLQLRDRDIWNNLAIMVGLPYLKRKLDESYDIHAPQATLLGPNYNRDALPENPTIRQRIMHYYKWFLRNIYPSINAAYYFSLLAFNLAYLFDNTKYSSPFLWLIGTRIRRLSEADHRAIALATEQSTSSTSHSRSLPGQVSILNPATLSQIVLPRLLSGLKILLPTSIFALKFLEWWHASDFARQLSKKAVEGLDIPPPVISGISLSQTQQSSADKTKPNFPMETPIPGPSSAHPATNTVSLSSPPQLPTTTTITPQTAKPSSSYPHPKKGQPPISSTSHLPIHTVPAPSRVSAPTLSLCPICLHEIQTPTSVQTGYVFCYTCIFKWIDGRHERQSAFMEGAGAGGEWDDDAGGGGEGPRRTGDGKENVGGGGESGSRVGRWESGRGRCAVTGRRVLGGTEGLRRVMV